MRFRTKNSICNLLISEQEIFSLKIIEEKPIFLITYQIGDLTRHPLWEQVLVVHCQKGPLLN